MSKTATNSRALKMNRRILKEIEVMKSNPNPCFEFIPPNDDNIRHFQAIINGPGGTPYEGGRFLLDIVIPDGYPKPDHTGRPRFKFISKVYHPNIGVNGDICLDILAGNYSPQSSLESLIVSLVSMFMDPNTSSPMNSEAGSKYDHNRIDFDATVKQWIEKYGFKGPAPAYLGAS